MIISAYGIQVVPAVNLLHAADPGRIAAQIVVGIGFLGTGVILQDRGRIRGITTAAELWVSAAFGMTIGLGLFFMATISLACVFIGLYSHNILNWIGLIPRLDSKQDKQVYVDQD
jgi:putative Mg2+ transporter-C (MgtC) family protein